MTSFGETSLASFAGVTSVVSFDATVSIASFGVDSDAVSTALSTYVQHAFFFIPLGVSFTAEAAGAGAELFTVSFTMGGSGLATDKQSENTAYPPLSSPPEHFPLPNENKKPQKTRFL